MPTRARPITVIILLVVGGQEFGLPVAVVRDTLRMRRTGRRGGWQVRGTEPDRPGDVPSIDVGGRPLPLVDLGAELGLTPGGSAGPRARSVVVVQSGDRWLGLLVDAIGDVVEVPREAVETVPRATVCHDAVCRVADLGDRAIGLLDADRLLPPDDQRTVA